MVSEERRKALFLHSIGEETLDIFETLTLSQQQEDESPLDVAIRALTEYFSPRRNREYEIYTFRQAKQNQLEDIAAYITRLLQLAATCEFTNIDAEIKSQMIQGCLSTRLRRKALIDRTLTLDAIVVLGRSTELAEGQAKNIEQELKSLSLSEYRVTDSLINILW